MKLHTAITAAALSTVLSTFALGAFAQPAPATVATPKIDARQAKQEARIDKGVASGALTPAETKKLDAEQGHISRVEHRAKADGVVTKPEAKKLTHLQNKASHDIKHQKHDRQVAVTK